MGGYLRVDSTYGGGVYGAPYWSGDGGYDTAQGNRFTSVADYTRRIEVNVGQG